MKFEYYDTVYTLYTRVSTYYANNNLAIEIVCWNEEDGTEPFASLTVNTQTILPANQAAVDTNNFPEAIQLIEEYRLGVPTGEYVYSGYCRYPIYEFNIQELKDYMIYHR